MSVVAKAPAHLSSEERSELIARLREFGSQQEESQQLSDRGSLERAADLMRLYEDKSWMEELPAPGRRSKVPPDDFRRFTKWAVEDNRLGVPRDKLTRLNRIAEHGAILRRSDVNLHDASGYSLLPLRWLVTNAYADRMPEVWRDARQLAGGGSPSETEVKRALSDWKKRNIEKPETGESSRAKGVPAKVRKLEDNARSLMLEAPTAVAPVLRKLLAELDERHAKSPLAGVL